MGCTHGYESLTTSWFVVQLFFINIFLRFHSPSISAYIYSIIKTEKRFYADISPDRNGNRRGTKPIGMDSGKLKSIKASAAHAPKPLLIPQFSGKYPFHISYRQFARTKNFNTTFEKIFCVHVRVNEPCVVINV